MDEDCSANPTITHCCDSQECIEKVKSLLDRALRHRFDTRELCGGPDSNATPACNASESRLLATPNDASDKVEKNEPFDKNKHLFNYDDAPPYLKHNPFIRTGYRGYLSTKLCLESVFWWTNETINIWSHVFGLLLFFSLTIYDLLLVNVHASFGDKVIVGLVLIFFQVCMFLSSCYHTFSCKSEHEFECLLSFDLFGIALSLLSIYMSGIYYAFWCHKELQQFYIISVTLIFIVAMVLQVPRFKINSNIKMLVFVAWAAYGVVPTFHWTIAQGGMVNPMVKLLLPRVLGMYFIVGLAFGIYISKIPERWFPGCVDYIGHSHQWWHLFVVVALYYWHNTGMIYVEYRMNHACAEHLRLH